MGLSSVVHVPSGTRLDRSMGLFSHYRVFSANRRYGAGAWDWPSEAKLTPEGAVEVRWPSAPDRPFEMRAVYRWAAPDTLDLETIIQAHTNLARFESFLASYFEEGFTNSMVYVKEPPGGQGKPGFVAAERSSGEWLAFPRDTEAVSIIKDGRWKFEPHPVDWVIMPRLAQPLGIRRAPASQVTALMMSSSKDCFALLTPFQTEPHYSMYLSLFGREVRAGETARARARLVIGAGLSERKAEELYQSYLRNER